MEYNLHIIGIAESWLTGNVDSSCVNIADFNLYRRDRDSLKDSRGGGVLLYVHKSLISYQTVVLNSYKCEAVGCNVQVGRKVYSFAVVYRSPSAACTENEEIFQVLNVLGSKEYGIIMGDFNYPGINWDNYSSSNNEEARFVDVLLDNYLHQHALTPTRGEAILDLVLSTEQNLIRELEIRAPVANSDHNSVCFKVLCKVSDLASDVVKNNVRYAYHKTDIIKFKDALFKWNWKEKLCNLSAVKMVDVFNDFMHDSMAVCIPAMKAKNKRQFPRWMTHRVKHIRKNKEMMWRKYKLSGTYNDYVEYKIVRNRATQEYRLAVYEFEKKLASNIKNDVKSFYAYVNKDGIASNVVASLVNDSNEVVVEKEIMCKMFNEYFSSVLTNENMMKFLIDVVKSLQNS